MSTTHYQANRILDHAFGATSFTPASTMYFGLSTTSISANGTGATEPSVGAYARASAANNKTTWGAAGSGSLTNLISISFIESTASWGTITHVFISDALTSGNMMYYSTLSPSRVVQSTTTVLFAASAITVTLT